MRWYNFFHIYQPPAWDESIVRRVVEESYRPLINILRRHANLAITLNITGSLTEQLLALGFKDVIDGFREFVLRGQVELVGSAMYHPILPLLTTDETRRQIDLQEQLCHQVFGSGVRLRGFFLPEMAYSPALDQTLIDAGYSWVILDELAFPESLGQFSFDRGYVTTAGLRVVFRHRAISDYLAFSSNLDRPVETKRRLLDDPRCQATLVTAMDGENLGHHRHGADKLWEKIATDREISTGTLSSYVDSFSEHVTVDPIASSWSSQAYELANGIPYGLWNHPDNPIHQAQWALTALVVEIVDQTADDPHAEAARRLLNQALSSDRYWWASASPWWDLAIVARETQKLADVVAPLSSLRPAAKNRVAHLLQSAITAAERWEKTGLAHLRQTTYLEQTKIVRYMAGQQVRPVPRTGT